MYDRGGPTLIGATKVICHYSSEVQRVHTTPSNFQLLEVSSTISIVHNVRVCSIVHLSSCLKIRQLELDG